MIRFPGDGKWIRTIVDVCKDCIMTSGYISGDCDGINSVDAIHFDARTAQKTTEVFVNDKHVAHWVKSDGINKCLLR